MKSKKNPDITELTEAIQILSKKIAAHNQSRVEVSFRSFLKGLNIALGATIGVSLVVGLLTFVLNQLKHIPLIQDLIYYIGIEQLLLG